MKQRSFINLTGSKFEKLTVICEDGKSGSDRLWLCQCQCGNITHVAGANLRSGATKSCGCILKQSSHDRLYKHGYTGTRIYRIWKNMKTRCYNQNSPQFKYWGARGISICDEWKNSFESFMKWSMDHGYSDELTIDRINNDGNYQPSNCRWTDYSTQNKNRRAFKGGKKNA